VIVDVQTAAPYHVGDTVFAQFVASNPRVSFLLNAVALRAGFDGQSVSSQQNDLRLEDTYLSVGSFVNGDWTTVRSDSHPSTIFQWARTSTVR